MDEQQARLAELMERLDRNIEIVTRDPARVLEANFKGTSRSGLVTVWVDMLGRVERVSLARDSVREGDEQLLINEFMAANANARRNAEELNFDGDAPRAAAPRRPVPPVDDDGGGYGASILRPAR